MLIPAEFLKESNYAGTRLIEITDPTVVSLKAEIAKLKPVAEPHLKRMEELSTELDPYFITIREHQAEIDRIKEQMAPTRALFDAEVAELEKIDQQAQLIKNKIQPIINGLLEGQLGEFEKALQVVDRDDGRIYVEVADEIEEKVKSIRMVKAQATSQSK